MEQTFRNIDKCLMEPITLEARKNVRESKYIEQIVVSMWLQKVEYTEEFPSSKHGNCAKFLSSSKPLFYRDPPARIRILNLNINVVLGQEWSRKQTEEEIFLDSK